MDDIKVDAKLIIIVICISAILGTILWAGYNFYESHTKNEDENIEYFEADMTSQIESNRGGIDNQINNKIDNEIDLNNIVGQNEFSINNNNTLPQKEGWVLRKHNFVGSGHYVKYYIPKDWEWVPVNDVKNGVRVKANMLKIENLTKDTTYDEFLNKFIQTMEEKEYRPNVDAYTQRTLNINGEDFYVITKEGYYNEKYSYFCLAYDQYAYYLEVSYTKDKYNQELISIMDEIFKTFKVY